MLCREWTGNSLGAPLSPDTIRPVPLPSSTRLYLTLWYSLLGLTLALFSAKPAFAQLGGQAGAGAHDTFVLSGSVLNSATGEPIPRALVRANGSASRSAFSDGDGRFQFEGLPAGQIILTAQKPGFFSDQEAGGSFVHPIEIGPNTGAQTIKLAPMSAIYGRVTDASNIGIEHISVRLTCRALRDGHTLWEPRGMSETDEDGHFRFASLMPGTYFLSVGPAQSEGQILPEGQHATTGFPHLYYPGVPDLNSAAPLQLAAGQQAEADFSLSPVPIYHVSGAVSGQAPDQGVGLMVFSTSGDELSLPVHFNMEVGTFSFDSVPAGTYVVKAVSSASLTPLRAEQRITVSSNLDNVHLTLSPAISIPVVVHMQSHPTSSGASASGSRWGEDHPPVSVALLPSQPNATESYSSFQQRGGHNVMVIQNVDPGSYTVKLMPQPPWYVQSASYGQTNVLYDDITVAAGQSYPLEVSLRDDSASLTATLRGDNARQQRATLIVVPQTHSKSSPLAMGGSGTYTLTGLPPGEYLVFAFDRIEGLEYSNPDALEPYASQAASITLSPGQNAQLSLDLIQRGNGR